MIDHLYLHATVRNTHRWTQQECDAVVEWAAANGIDATRIPAASGVDIRSPRPDSLDGAILVFEEYHPEDPVARIERTVPMTVPLPDPATFPVSRWLPREPCPCCGHDALAALVPAPSPTPEATER